MKLLLLVSIIRTSIETKPITFDQVGNMYVTVGAPSNACQIQDRTKGSLGMDPCPILELHGGIWRFKDDVLNQDQAKDGYRYATGIRNAVAIRWNDQENRLYAMQHADAISCRSSFPNYITISKARSFRLRNFCWSKMDQILAGPIVITMAHRVKKYLLQNMVGDGQKVDRCSAADDPIMAFPAHMAPNDVLFIYRKYVS